MNIKYVLYRTTDVVHQTVALGIPISAFYFNFKRVWIFWIGKLIYKNNTRQKQNIEAHVTNKLKWQGNWKYEYITDVKHVHTVFIH